jgi:hypothetical protein
VRCDPSCRHGDILDDVIGHMRRTIEIMETGLASGRVPRVHHARGQLEPLTLFTKDWVQVLVATHEPVGGGNNTAGVDHAPAATEAPDTPAKTGLAAATYGGEHTA